MAVDSSADGLTVDESKTAELRTEKRRQRLERGIPAAEYKRRMKERLIAGDILEPARALYADVLAVSAGSSRMSSNVLGPVRKQRCAMTQILQGDAIRDLIDGRLSTKSPACNKRRTPIEPSGSSKSSRSGLHWTSRFRLPTGASVRRGEALGGASREMCVRQRVRRLPRQLEGTALVYERHPQDGEIFLKHKGADPDWQWLREVLLSRVRDLAPMSSRRPSGTPSSSTSFPTLGTRTCSDHRGSASRADGRHADRRGGPCLLHYVGTGYADLVVTAGGLPLILAAVSDWRRMRPSWWTFSTVSFWLGYRYPSRDVRPALGPKADPEARRCARSLRSRRWCGKRAAMACPSWGYAADSRC